MYEKELCTENTETESYGLQKSLNKTPVMKITGSCDMEFVSCNLVHIVK